MNLVGNGVKFTESGCVEVRVSAERTDTIDATLLFQVCDMGAGIPIDAQRDLFDPFTQADASTTRRYGGTGLGLAITKQLIDLMGGKVGVESELGEGSTFWFRLDLPLVPAPSTALSPVPRGLHILLIEDHALLRTGLVHYLDGWKVQYSATGNAEQALHLIQKAAATGAPYDCVIIGKEMTGMSPLQFTGALLKDTSLPVPPLVLLGPVRDVHQFEGLPRGGERPDFARSACGSVQRHRGAVWRDWYRTPRRPGGGTTGTAEGGDASVSFERKRILLVEDNLVNQQVAFEMLSVVGIEVHIASNGQEALEKFRSEPFDLVFMDCQMPVLDGLQATRMIREYERQKAGAVTPIIALTASAMIGNREKCISAGMNDYLPKPFRMLNLKSMLTRWLA